MIMTTGLLRQLDQAAPQSSELDRMVGDAGLSSAALGLVLERREALGGEVRPNARAVAVDVVPGPRGGTGLIARGEVVVVGPSTAAERDLLAAAGFTLLGSVGVVQRYRKAGAAPEQVIEVCEELASAGCRAAPNYITIAGYVIKAARGLGGARATSVDLGPRPTDDPRGAGVTVAVLDSAVDVADVFAEHGWLEGVHVNLDGDAPADVALDAAYGHGSFVAGLVRQAAPACSLRAVAVLAGDGLGTDYALAEALLSLLDTDQVPDVVNLSLSCAIPAGEIPLAMAEALDRLTSRHPELVLVAAAGNDGGTLAPWPAAHPHVLAVAAATPDGEPAEYSNRGPWVDFSVPADGVVSTHPPVASRDAAGAEEPIDTGYASWSGTSFAAPQVAGQLAALIGTGRSAMDALAILRADGEPHSGVGHFLGEPR